MDAPNALIYTFQNQVFFENIDRYKPTIEYISDVKAILPSDWVIEAEGFWTKCTPKNWRWSSHGWKIHVSTAFANARETINTVVPLLEKLEIAFKLVSDPRLLKISLGKTWSRFQIGKFIVIYPSDLEQFKQIIEIIYQKTKHLAGPHILTDRPYRDSKVVFYRYGAFITEYRLDPYGRRHPGFLLVGQWHDDVRGPTFCLPPGITDPFETQQLVNNHSAEPPREIILADRYAVRGAIKFSATGGIYHGLDNHTGRQIVIREVNGALGHLESEISEDPAFAIKREARILQKLAPTGVVPEFVDIFKEWNNWFLVEEKLEASTLWHHSMDIYVSDESQRTSMGFDRIRTTIEAIANGLEVIHSLGVVLRDLTKTNVLLTRDGKAKFIDFEFAYELNDDMPWVKGFTPGYASIEQKRHERPTVKDDYYALGVLILDMITFSSAGLDLDRNAILRKLKQNLNDLNLPMEMYDIVVGLIEVDVEKRWSSQKALARLRSIPVGVARSQMLPGKMDLLNVDAPEPELVRELKEIEKGLCTFLDSAIDLSREDRLWPSSVDTFITNPVSLQFGAAGVASFLLRSCGDIDPRIADWIMQHALPAQCPPALYSGLAGVALFLLNAGRIDGADSLLSTTDESSLAHIVPGLYFGAAGIGLTNLHFWKATGKLKYIQRAVAIGDELLSAAKVVDNGVYWLTNGKIQLGLGEGQSGIALFLMYLGLASQNDKLIHAAGRALDFDVANGIRFNDRILWKTRADAKANEPNLPHTRHGSSGVGTACIRYFAVTSEKKYRDIALECANTVRTRVTNKIWQDNGNAGFGEFMLDMAHFLGDERYENLAYYQAEAITPHAINYNNGIAFAGVDHFRICSDFSHGGAGIGMFINRLLNRKPRFLMLDELIQKH